MFLILAIVVVCFITGHWIIGLILLGLYLDERR